MITDNEPHQVNENIEDRIANIQNDDIKAFLKTVVSHERENLHLSQPEYKDKYRTKATEHIESSDDAQNINDTHE